MRKKSNVTYSLIIYIIDLYFKVFSLPLGIVQEVKYVINTNHGFFFFMDLGELIHDYKAN